MSLPRPENPYTTTSTIPEMWQKVAFDEGQQSLIDAEWEPPEEHAMFIGWARGFEEAAQAYEGWVKLPDTEELADWFSRMFVGTHTLSELAQKLTEWLQGERE